MSKPMRWKRSFTAISAGIALLASSWTAVAATQESNLPSAGQSTAGSLFSGKSSASQPSGQVSNSGASLVASDKQDGGPSTTGTCTFRKIYYRENPAILPFDMHVECGAPTKVQVTYVGGAKGPIECIDKRVTVYLGHNDSVSGGPSNEYGSASELGGCSYTRRSYLVITEPGQTASVSAAIAANQGAVYATYDAIGVVVVHSSFSGFASQMRLVPGVEKVGATRTSNVPAQAIGPIVAPAPAQTVPTVDESVRPHMQQIGADRAWDVTTGSNAVTVAVLDTG
ncbi:hypothetical protein ACIP6Y_36670, partial [Streptomyces sp. NPDC088748]